MRYSAGAARPFVRFRSRPVRVYGAAPEPTVEERKSTFVFQPSGAWRASQGTWSLYSGRQAPDDTFGTILNANGENPKVIQELLRHANLKVTMDTYVQAVSDEKRKAQSKVVKMLLPGIRKREAV